jgi:DNA-directed RNA polymerase I and III subunit RPAC1
MAEVPTICIESVYVFNNTSIVVDEIFAHRLGLVPLNVDPALVDMKEAVTDQATDRNTLVFRLAVSCARNNPAPTPPTTDSTKLYTNSEVLSSHLEWDPQGEQAVVYADNPPAPTNPNIVLAKLRPGQEVEMEMHAVKGVGKDHAKFSPVATASYRLLPLIILNPEKPVPAHLATKFQECFSPGVICVDPRTKQVSVDETRKDTVSREVLRHPEFEGCVELKRVRDFFLCECGIVFLSLSVQLQRHLPNSARQSTYNRNHSIHLNGFSLKRSK